MKFWLKLPNEPVDTLLGWARDAEDIGYDGIALPDHLLVPAGETSSHPTGFVMPPDFSFPDPISVFAAMSATTTRLRFMTYVYVVPLRDPFSLAKQVATLQLLSNDRFSLGVGVGWLREELGAIGVKLSTRGRLTDEMLDVMRDLWDDGFAEHHGEFFDFPRSAMFPLPVRQPEILIGGMSDAAARRAARHDGYMPLDGLNDRTRQQFSQIDAIRAEHGRTGDFERVVQAPTEMEASVVRRIESEDGITAITVAPISLWDDPSVMPTHVQRIDLAKRYAETVIGRL